MDRRRPTFEATLLSRNACKTDLAQLRATLNQVLLNFGERPQSFERLDSVYSLLTGRHVQILLALDNSALPLDGFMGAANQPSRGKRGAEILACLTETKSSATLILMPRRDSDQFQDTFSEWMSVLAWHLTSFLFRSLRSDLVFWAETETLYAADEFVKAAACAETSAAAPQAPKRRFAEEPNLAPAVRAWFEGRSNDPTKLPGVHKPRMALRTLFSRMA